MKTRSKRIKKSPINFRAEGLAVSATWVDILCREIKHTIFNIYTTSLTSRVLFDNKVLIVALSMFKQLQIIALCFLPQFSLFYRKHSYLRYFKLGMDVVNFGTLVENLPDSVQDSILMFMTFSVLGLIGFIFFANNSLRLESKSKIDRYKVSWATSALMLFIVEVLPIPYAVLYGSRIACYDFEGKGFTSDLFQVAGETFHQEAKMLTCSDRKIPMPLQVFYSVQFFAFIWIIHFFKKLDFDQRAIDKNFGVKRSNEIESHILLIQTATILALSVLKDFPVGSCTLLLLSVVITFVFKTISNDYICRQYRRYELSTSVLSLWFVLSLTFTMVTNEIYGDSLYPFFLSFLALMITLWLKSISLGIKVSAVEPKHLKTAHDAVLRLEVILWMFNLSDSKGEDYVRKVFDGFYQSVLTTKNKQKVRDEEHDEDDTRTLIRSKSFNLSEEMTTSSLKSKVKIVEFMIKNYFEAVRKFKDDITLRISLLYYLVDFTPFWNIALQTLECLELESSSKFKLEHKIKIFRLRQMIEEVHLIRNKQQASQSKQAVFREGKSPSTNQFITEMMALRLNNRLNNLLEKSSNKYGQLWKILQGDKTVERELNSCSRMFDTVNQVWDSNRAIINNFNITAKRNYGLFLIHILKVEKEGRAILNDYFFNEEKRAKKKHEIGNLMLRDKLEEISDPLLMVKINRDGSDLRIQNCNLEFCQKVGYQRTFLLQRKFKVIVPKHSLKFYRKLVRQAKNPTQNPRTALEIIGSNKSSLNSDGLADLKLGAYCKISIKRTNLNAKFSRQINLMKSNGSLEFFSAQIKVCKVTDLESFLLVKLVPNFSGKVEGNILINRRGRILGNNSKCLGVLPEFDRPDLKAQRFKNITEVLPGIKRALNDEITYIEDLLNKPPQRFSSLVNHHPPTRHKNHGPSSFVQRASKANIKNFDFKLEEMDDSKFFRLRLFSVKSGQRKFSINDLGSSFLGTSTNQSKINNLGSRKNSFSVLKPLNNSNKEVRKFEFRLSKNLQFVLKWVEQGDEKLSFDSTERKGAERMNDLSVVQEEEGSSDLLANLRRQVEDDQKFNSLVVGVKEQVDKSTRINYGAGIRIKRIVDGFIRDVYDEEEEGDIKDMDDAQGFRGANSVFNSNEKGARNGESVFLNGDGLRLYSQKQLNIIVMKKRKRIRSLRWFRVCWVLHVIPCIVFMGINFLNNQADINSVSGLVNLERNTAKVSALFQEVLGRINDLCLLNQGIDLLYDSEYRGKIKQQKLEALEMLRRDYQDIIVSHNTFETLPTNIPSFDLLRAERLKKNVALRVNGKSTNFTYKNAIYNVLSIVAKTIDKGEDKITFEDSDVDYLRYNIGNGLHLGIVRVSRANGRARTELSDHIAKPFIYRVPEFFASSFVMILVTLITVRLSKLAKERAVECFYGFRDIYVEKLIKLCESFSTVIQQESLNLDKSGGNNLDFDELNVFDNSDGFEEFSQNGQKKGNHRGEAIFKKSKESYDGFIKLKKRKKKGRLVKIYGVWETIVIASITANIIFYFSREENHIKMIQKTINNSMYIFQLNLVYVTAVAVRNGLMSALIDERITQRGVRVMRNARGYEGRLERHSHSLLELTAGHIEKGDIFERKLKQVYENDICESFSDFKTNTTNEIKVPCPKIINGYTKKGLFITIEHAFETYKKFYSHLKFLFDEEDGEAYPFKKHECQQFNSTLSQTTQKRYCLLSSKLYIDISHSLRKIIAPYTQGLANYVLKISEKEIEDYFETEILFVSAYAPLAIIYMLVIMVSAESFNQEVVKINQMMRFHSISEISKNKRMHRYLSQWRRN